MHIGFVLPPSQQDPRAQAWRCVGVVQWRISDLSMSLTAGVDDGSRAALGCLALVAALDLYGTALATCKRHHDEYIALQESMTAAGWLLAALQL